MLLFGCQASAPPPAPERAVSRRRESVKPRPLEVGRPPAPARFDLHWELGTPQLPVRSPQLDLRFDWHPNIEVQLPELPSPSFAAPSWRSSLPPLVVSLPSRPELPVKTEMAAVEGRALGELRQLPPPRRGLTPNSPWFMPSSLPFKSCVIQLDTGLPCGPVDPN